MDYQKLIRKAEKWVTDYYQDNFSAMLLYHNLDHTMYVVKAAHKLADFSTLSDDEQLILFIGAWFFDLGFVNGTNDPDRAVSIAKNFLIKHEVDDQIIEKVTSIILVANSKRSPKTIYDEIIADSVTYYFGKKKFLEILESQRKENELLQNTETNREQWLKKALERLERHRFYTMYCRQNLQEEKTGNINAIKKELAGETKTETAIQNDKSIKEVKENKEKAERATETMFKIASSNSQRLSSMADNKAHILITVNSIILSAVISLLLRKLDENRYLIIPTIILLSISLGSMVFSILATRPSLPAKSNRFQINGDAQGINLLFFGNYFRMDFDTYRVGMLKLMQNIDAIHESLIKDTYSQGHVLGKKYKLLRTSYNIFMFGLIISVFAFVITLILHGNSMPVLPDGPLKLKK